VAKGLLGVFSLANTGCLAYLPVLLHY